MQARKERALAVASSKYDFYHQNDGDSVWWAESPDMNDGEFLFSFDRKRIFNFFSDYPQALTPSEKEIFDRENPELIKLKGE